MLSSPLRNIVYGFSVAMFGTWLCWGAAVRAETPPETAPPEAAAQDGGQQPLTISAERALEWDRNNSRYIARGAVEVRQGDTAVFADLMYAYYGAGAAGGMGNITRIEMEGNIRVESPPYTAYGTTGVYDVTGGKATLIGDNLKIVTPGETITAKNMLEYDREAQTFTASGDARVVRGVHVLDAENLTALFGKAKGSEDRLALKEVRARGNVVLSTPREKIRGKAAVYSAASDIAVMTGGISIEQGQNVLHGDKAQMDMKTGVSQLIAGGGAGDGRVHGVFYPSTDKN